MTISHDSSFMGLRNATRLIDSLDNVRVLTIINDHWGEEPWTPDEIDNISKLSSVEVLRLQGDSSMVVRLLEAFPKLHSFQLSQTEYGLTTRGVQMSLHNQTLSRKVALRFLSLPNLESSVNSSIVELFTGPKFDYTNLQSLKLDSRIPFGHVPQEHQADSFLKKCGQHVQNLTFVFPSHSLLNNGTLPKFFLSNDLFFKFQPLSQGLSRLSSLSAPGLQSITLDVFLFLRYSWRSIFTDLKALPEWGPLDDFLSKSDSLPSLTELQVRFSIDLDVPFLNFTYTEVDLKNISRREIETPIQQRLSQILESCLPRTHRSGKLRVAFRTIVFKSLSILGQRASSWNEGRPGTGVMSYAFEV
ncbi:hypothetical protein VKT23_008889 [Stygiomarasmius scandens]|uniref:F-box domain-containing protein n=1 Tax=Marasmiellus scandens TaxID=2682957 RepID=A0ABR1JL53_9AGAR